MFTHGTHVNFIGFTGQNGVKYEPVKTYIWAFLEFPAPVGFKYIIEHPHGFSKQDFFDERFEPAINKYLDTKLQDGKLYLFVLSTDMEEITPEPAPNVQPNKQETPPVQQQQPAPEVQQTTSEVKQTQQPAVSEMQEQKTPEDFTIKIGDKDFALQEEVFNLIHNISKERDMYKVALIKINEALQEMDPAK